MGEESRFDRLIPVCDLAGADTVRLDAAVNSMKRSSAEFAEWLTQRYLPAANPDDAVGRERYLAGVDEFIGMSIDPEETYEWGWDEMRRLDQEMRQVAEQVLPGADVFDVIDMLETDPGSIRSHPV